MPLVGIIVAQLAFFSVAPAPTKKDAFRAQIHQRALAAYTALEFGQARDSSQNALRMTPLKTVSL